MPNLLVLVGLPGSGKSTIASNFESFEIFSSDKYRELLLGDASNQSNNDLVFSTLYKNLNSYLLNGGNAILDATNITLKSRLNLLDHVKDIPNLSKKCLIVNTPITICIKNDSKRERKVGDAVILKMEKSFQCPQYFEGWDDIKIDKIYKEKPKEETEILPMMKGFEQQNPYHKFTLDIHCNKVGDYFKENPLLSEAGHLHDIGKLLTQTFDDLGVAHYYNHANVGVYYLLSHSYIVKNNILDVLFYINYHMLAHDLKEGTKSYNKYLKLFGSSKLEMLLKFAEIDKKSAKE